MSRSIPLLQNSNRRRPPVRKATRVPEYFQRPDSRSSSAVSETFWHDKLPLFVTPRSPEAYFWQWFVQHSAPIRRASELISISQSSVSASTTVMRICRAVVHCRADQTAFPLRICEEFSPGHRANWPLVACALMRGALRYRVEPGHCRPRSVGLDIEMECALIDHVKQAATFNDKPSPIRRHIQKCFVSSRWPEN